MPPIRCGWVSDDPLYISYHDEEWGVPLYDDQQLFELLLLEGAQAGLSWITVLKRRAGYREAYEGFDPIKMARWSDEKIASLLQDKRIIRNRLKVEAARKNARAYLRILEEESFSDFLWSFVDGQPVQNAWTSLEEVPAYTQQSDAMSKALKKRGFSFVGSTICYAFMQAAGMVNDHVVDCICYERIQ